MLLDLRNSRLVASSGIRRLQIYQLQEQELIKDAIRKAVKEKLDNAKNDEHTGKLATPEVKRVARPARKKPATPKKSPEVEIPIIPFKALPTTPEPSVFELLALLPPIATECYLLSLTTSVIIDLGAERKKRRKKVAAFLLLAA
jgi:hypothetical protein